MGARFPGLARFQLVAVVCGLSSGIAALTTVRAEPPAGSKRIPSFEQEIMPLLTSNCLKCHGVAELKGGVDLRSKAAMLKGGDSGPILVPGSVEESLLVEVVRKGEMPPARNNRLTRSEVSLIKDWVDAGAPAQAGAIASDTARPSRRAEAGAEHWAFHTLARPATPALNDRSRLRTPVDAFVLARLQAKGLSFSADADKATLVRRIYLDLLGLPPMAEDVREFVDDPRPDAYERLVDRLLESIHFGERWGRHWLDGAGFVDILGCDNDAARIKSRENKWRYRDYVIRSFNADKPFDRFLTEQLAGDELVDWRSAKALDEPARELLIATGFLRNSADDTDEKELNTPDIRHGVLQRTGEVVVGNLLGLTFQCAKCHDHKYEPITQRDYYRVLALLQPAFNPASWLQPDQRQLPDVSPVERAEIERRNAEIDGQVAAREQSLSALKRPYEEKLKAARWASLPAPIRDDVRAALQTPAPKRSEVRAYLAAKFESFVKIKPEEIAAALNENDRAAAAALERQIADWNGKRRAWGVLQVVYDVGPPTPTYLLRRGNHLTPGAAVQPGFIEVLCTSDRASELASTHARGASSGRRLALARWLNDDPSPAGALVLRVRVNRVWQHLFGRGIVETPDNFGVTGTAPTHPELLEWLACEFLANGKRLKPLVRLLATSTAYRQAAVRTGDSSGDDPRRIDPENLLLWRMRLRRLESEAVRDRILAVSGTLDRTVGGRPVPVEPRPDGTFVIPEQGLPTPTSRWRRSIYLLARRNYHPSLLDAFDQPDLATNCTRRATSAVVLQSLAMLNDRFVLEQADHLAGRVAKASDSSPASSVRAAFTITLGRPPTPTESAGCVAVLNRGTAYFQAQGAPPAEAALKSLGYLCHTLLNTSEFLYVP